MTASPAKFSFGNDMSARREKSSVLPDSRLKELLAEAREQGFAEGHQAGEAAASARAAEALQAAGEKLVQKAEQALAAVDAYNRKTLGEAVRLAAAIARKLAPQLVQQEPSAELEALLAESLMSIDSAPHLVIRCNDELAETLKKIAETRIAHSGFTGRLIVMGEPDIALGDGRLEWADGGIVRNSEEISKQIDGCISAYLAAKGVPEAEAEETE